jgi:hypothetical protein
MFVPEIFEFMIVERAFTLSYSGEFRGFRREPGVKEGFFREIRDNNSSVIIFIKIRSDPIVVIKDF